VAEIGPGLGSFFSNAIDYGTTANPSALYVGKDDKVQVRLAGTTFTETTPGTGGDEVVDVVIDPASDQRAYAIDRNQVFSTANAGAAWTEITGNIMSLAGTFLQTIEFIPGTAGAVVVGGALGVFTAMIPNLSAATTWIEVGMTTLPNAIVYELEYNATDNVLLAGTLGRGAWLASNANELANVSTVPTVESVVIDDGTAQRSMIRKMVVTFDRVVTLAADAITLAHQTLGNVAFTLNTMTNANSKTEATLTFSGIGGSLADGNYKLTVDATKVTANSVNMAANRVEDFYRYFGDKIGTDRAVDPADLAPFRATFGKPMVDLAFDDDFDFNADGAVDPVDLAQFRARFGVPLVAPPPALPPAAAFVVPDFRVRRHLLARDIVWRTFGTQEDESRTLLKPLKLNRYVI
jgi:hypothetical protein